MRRKKRWTDAEVEQLRSMVGKHSQGELWELDKLIERFKGTGPHGQSALNKLRRHAY